MYAFETFLSLVILLSFPRTNLSSFSLGLLPTPVLWYLTDLRWLLHGNHLLPMVLLVSELEDSFQCRCQDYVHFLHFLCFLKWRERKSIILSFYCYIPMHLGYVIPILLPLSSKERTWLFPHRSYRGNSHHIVLSHLIII